MLGGRIGGALMVRFVGRVLAVGNRVFPWDFYDWGWVEDPRLESAGAGRVLGVNV